jgi:hypothetical protein
MNDYPPLFIAMLALFAVVILGIIGYFLYNLAQSTVTRKARVTGKRRLPIGPGRSVAECYCTFEFEDGTRNEYRVGERAYSQLADNDVGDLVTKGTLFWGFRSEREGYRLPSDSPMTASIPEEPLARITDALFRGQKIEAIRLYRECTGSALGEAKTAVEQLEAKLRAAEPDRFG